VNLNDTIRAAVQARAEATVELLRALVRFPSVSYRDRPDGDEGPAQAWLADYLRGLGLEVEVFEPGPDALHHPGQPWPGGDFAGRPNVFGWWHGRGGGRSLILNSHIDVVPAGDETEWRFGPFSGEVAEGRLWGRGSVDAKGCLAAFVGAVAALKAAGIQPRGTVLLQSVVAEETGGAGALAAVLRGPRADAALIGEPTALDVCPACRGFLTYRCTVHGRTAHPGAAHEGVNAIHEALSLLAAVPALSAELDRRNPHPLWALAPTAHLCSVTTVEGGRQGQAIPDRCTFGGSIGLAPGDDLEETRRFVERYLHEVAATDPWLHANPPELVWLPRTTAPAGIDADHPLARTLAATVQSTIGRAPTVRAFWAASDMRFLANQGGMPCVHFGPGDLRLGHCPNEALPIDELLTATEVVARFIVEWCEV